MTEQDINEMASECGLIATPHIEAFAKLVAAKEREDLCKYFQELEDKATSVRDKMYLSGVQFVIRARGKA